MPYIFGNEQVPACRESGVDKPGKAQRTVLSGMEGKKPGGQVPAVRSGDLARECCFEERLSGSPGMGNNSAGTCCLRVCQQGINCTYLLVAGIAAEF